MSAAMLTANEQLFLELVNRARLDPLAEAARQGIDLNAGLPDPGQGLEEIGPAPVQALAPNAQIQQAAAGHGQWMLDTDTFAHTGAGGSNPADRMIAAGYVFEGNWAWGENLAMVNTTGALDTEAAIGPHFGDLYASPGHRVNMFDGNFRETGVAQSLGVFTAADSDGVVRDWNTSMLTHKFGLSGSSVFLTGVVYDDQDADGFYSVGEGVGAAPVAAGGAVTTTWAAGGYSLALDSNPAVAVTLGDGAGAIELIVDMSGDNVKLDLVDGNRILTSGNIVLGAGATDVEMLGAVDNSVTGNALDNQFHLGGGDNTLIGGGGADTAVFTGLSTEYRITTLADGRTEVADLRGGPDTNGTNLLTDITFLRFADETQTIGPPATGTVALGGTLRAADGTAVGEAGLRFTLSDGTVLDTLTDAGGAFGFDLPDGATGHLDLADGNGPHAQPTVTDALDILRLAVGLAPSFGPATPHDLIAADVDRSGQVGVSDALDVLRVAVGLGADGVGDAVLLGSDQPLDHLTPSDVSYSGGVQLDGLTADAHVELTLVILGDPGATLAV
ncbi:CAP domain-containing protein [Roseovarius ramblicola]|uniref:CAP domain-containing protein n=1 Tax=Roseovarius ramblicola TaxID=2022336 RepID=A0ABV5I067_9RHOB